MIILLLYVLGAIIGFSIALYYLTAKGKDE
jgi:hypothetical protein